MSMDMEQALQTFLEESRDLLQQMEDALLYLESAEQDEDTVNAMFRAAHTIKGSAGLFALDYVVSFTHVVENILDKVRDGKLRITADLTAILLPCCDHIGVLIDESVTAAENLEHNTIQNNEMLLGKLRPFLHHADPEKTGHDNKVHTSQVPTEQQPSIETVGGAIVATDNWHISLRFGHDVLRNGMDPLSFLRYLGTLGEIISITTLHHTMPDADEMDPESCYLGFEIEFSSTATKNEIESVFEFVREDCNINILPPHSLISEYIRMIHELPEEDARLGEILIKSGALTQKELDDGLASQGTTISSEPSNESGMGSASPIGDILVGQGSVQQQVVDAAVERQQQMRDKKVQESRFIRVQADKLDQLINLVGELVIAGASANLLAQRSGDGVLQESTSTISRLVEEIRDGALQLRMVQIGETFNRFQRVVRDVSKELGKDIELIVTGAETELDKTVVEKIGDPLMHLVRNSMDHGIESADKRQAAGKPAKGHLRLNAYHDSGSIVIEVADDGAGLNKDKILQKAWEKGIVSPNQNLTDKEIYNLIFEAGFSTADAVSNLSGRGVGMDVVRRNIETLRGTVDLDSTEGAGTTVRIRLPLTLAIIDGFLVGVGKSGYVVPLDMVMECVELSDMDRKAAQERSYLNLRGEVLPFVRLREQFEVEGAAARRENVVVVHYAGQKAGLVVDELMGEFQTVIKPMGKLFSNLRGISGSTILGSGEVALILDVPSLVQQTVAREAHHVSVNQSKNLVAAR